jgi:hypothetical protein
MKRYIVKKGDTLDSIAKHNGIKDGKTLQIFHNTNCTLEELIGTQIPEGSTLYIPEESDSMAETQQTSETSNSKNSNSKPTNFNSNSNTHTGESTSYTQVNRATESEHDGKYFVVQKGQCQCDQGFKFPKFQVTSHQKIYWNDADGQSEYLAVTETDLQFDPVVEPFGKCKLKPSSGGYLPCTYAPAGKWTKTYENVKIMGNSCVTEISELRCTTGGKITIFKHGQQSEASGNQVAKANPDEQQSHNPIMDFEEFQQETDTENNYAY